ncbi:MAG TPA: EthD family reductase [Trebonia sp.]
MATLMILYGHPDDPAAFEDYYANRHIPYASTHMPGVCGAENMKVVSGPERPGTVLPRIAAEL